MARSWLASTDFPLSSRCSSSVETTSNPAGRLSATQSDSTARRGDREVARGAQQVAVGATPLGPFFDGGAVPDLVVPIDDRSVAADYVAEPGVLTVVVGRELHRDDGALAAADTIAASSDALIVDMGFTNSDHIDIATFGASRLVGVALLELLGTRE